MTIFGSISLLIALFIVLGISADFLVHNIKIISNGLGIKIFALGIILGIITSLPEMVLGINASIKNIPNISAGNLLGGIIILFGLILGASLVLNRKIKTDGNLSNLLPQTLFIFCPLLLGIDGKFGLIDGIIIIIIYISLILFLYNKNKDAQSPQVSIIKRQKNFKSIFIIIISVVILIATSELIMNTSISLLNKINVNPFILGLLLFSIGTNLPEITITLTSWRKKSGELSFSHLMGSAMANIMILGLISIINPINIVVGIPYLILSSFIIFTLILVMIFYKTNKSLNRVEGIFLILLYILFVYLNIFVA